MKMNRNGKRELREGASTNSYYTYTKLFRDTEHLSPVQQNNPPERQGLLGEQPTKSLTEL
jgi:hypothetical protein